MFRGRPQFRDYPPPRPHPSSGYRDDRARQRPSYHQEYPDYRDHGAPNSYHRRYPSPGPGGHRGGEYWTGGPPPERSPSHRGPAHLEHNLLNDLIGPHGSGPHHHDRDYPPRPEYERSGSRGQSPGRSKSRHRGQSRSPDRSGGRSKSRHRGQSRSPDRGRGRSKSRHRGQSRSPDRSRGRSKSRHRGQSRSPDRSRGQSKSRGRSKSRHRSKSRSRSRGKSRERSRSRHRSNSSSSSSSSIVAKKVSKFTGGLEELEMARRKREVEGLLGQPTKSILKKHNSYEDSPSVRSSDSPGGLDRTMGSVADQLLQAVKQNDPRAVASVLSELRSDPQMSQRANLNNEIKEILSLLGLEEPLGGTSQEVVDDIEDEEKFLYGDLEEPKTSAEAERHHSLDLYGDVTEDSLYSELPSQRAVVGQVYPPTISSQAPPTVSRPSISPDRNAMDHAYPPGTEPLEESERQALEEYEQIQDLLKTIGLDLGVNEITKMAARTKERLHGNKQPPKTPTRRQRYSSGSSDGSRHGRGQRRRNDSGSSSSSSSNSRSRSRGRGTKRGASWSSEDHESKKSAAPKTPRDWEVKEPKSEWSTPAIPQASDPAPIPTHTSMPIPTYPPPQLPGMMPPNYPPSAYGQYGNYLPYMHQQWPPMYPPPNMALPPQTATDSLPPPLPPAYNKPYNKLAPEPGVKGFPKNVCQAEQRRRSQDHSVSDEQNNESEKQKVLEEREKLKQEREVRMTKKEYLIKELERLRKQQGELLRKKRREKDGHKDPLLQEINRLQEEVMAQISNLRKEHEAAEKKRSEIEKVARILGLSPLDRPSKISKQSKSQERESPSQKEKTEPERKPEERPAASSSASKPTPSKASPVKETPTPVALPPDPFEYYDAGNHWCKSCNTTSGSMFDFFTHLQSKQHRKTMDPYDRPWASSPTKIPKVTKGEARQTKPAKGSEFLVPVRGFFCLLCKEFYGDGICAEDHVITHAHNENYKKQMLENPLYEQRRNLDRQAGLCLEASGKKRKHDDDDDKGRDEKSKNKKDKKDKKKEDEPPETSLEKIKVKKLEEEQNVKAKANRKSLEENKSSYVKKDEDEKHKYSKKEEKYLSSREDEGRTSRYKSSSSSSRDEEYRYHCRKDDSQQHDDHPKYSSKYTDSKYKQEKSSDARFQFDRERDEGKPKAQKESDKPAEKPEVRKSELPQKPYELPKIFCGPSPAMRARLRKQSLEAEKASSSTNTTTNTTTTTLFGKFMWKKKESKLEKEARKVAAEFLKEEEMAAKRQPDEDPFSKSVMAAKEIAEKLAGEELKPPNWFIARQGQIRPRLRAPVQPLRRLPVAGRPASLNTFLNMTPQGTNVGFPTPFPLRPPNPQSFNNNPEASFKTSGPLEKFEPEPFGPQLPPSMLKPDSPARSFGPPAAVSKPVSAESKPAPSETKPGPVFTQPALVQSKPAPVTGQSSTVSSVLLNTGSSENKSTPSEANEAVFKAPSTPLTPPKATPSEPALIEIVSDVAAPGVPESEQTRTVFVKPPPFKTMLGGAQKPEKLQSNLAAAKAQALFDIFYSSLGQSGPSSFSKTETDFRTVKSSPSAPQAFENKTQPLTQNNPKPQPQNQPPNKCQTWSQNQPEPQDEPKPQTQNQPELQDKPEPQPENQSPPKRQTRSQSQPVPQGEPKPQPQNQPSNKRQTRSQKQPQPQDEPKPQPQNQPELQDEPKPQPQTQLEAQDEPQPQIQPKSQDEPQSRPQIQLAPQDEPQSRPQIQLAPQDEPQSQPQIQLAPQDEPQSLPQIQLAPQDEPQSQPQIQLAHQDEPKPELQDEPQPELQDEPQSEPQIQLAPKDEPQSQPQIQLAPQDEPQSQQQIQLASQDEPQSQPQIQLAPQNEPEPELQGEKQPQIQMAPQDEPQSQPQIQLAPQDKPQPELQDQPQPELQDEPQPQIQLAPQDKPQSQPQIQLASQDEPQPVHQDEPQPVHQDEPQPQIQLAPQYESQPELQDEPPSQVQLQSQDEPKFQQQTQPQPFQDQSVPQTLFQQQSPLHTPSYSPNIIQTSPQNHFGSPQIQIDADIQITSVWSLQDTITAEAAFPEQSGQICKSEKSPSAHTEGLPQGGTTNPGPECQIIPENTPIILEPTSEPPSKPDSEPQIDQDANSHPEMTQQSQPKPKSSSRTRGKSTPMKKTPPTPPRQTRSQTRYQTRQQQQSQPEPTPAAVDQDITASESTGLESTDPQLETDTVKEMDLPGSEVSPETLGLPSDFTPLDFDYSFNFE